MYETNMDTTHAHTLFKNAVFLLCNMLLSLLTFKHFVEKEKRYAEYNKVHILSSITK